MTRRKGIEEISASGTPAKMGERVGRECAPISRSMLSIAKTSLRERSIAWDAAVESSANYLPFAESHDSAYIDYIRGYARGAAQRFADLFLLLCLDEEGFCTDIAVNMEATADGTVLSAHTEDWRPDDEKHIVLLRGAPEKGPSFLLMTLGGLEFVGGLNSAGISYTGNSLSQNDERIGIPKMFLANRMARAKTLSEAVSAALALERGSSYNSNICHSSGEMYCVEASATDSVLIYPQSGYLVHTNHYLHPKMARYESLFSEGSSGTYMPTGSSSILRYNRASRLLRKSLGRVTRQTLETILSDHVNYPDSICRHPLKGARSQDQNKTIYATVADVTNLDLWVCLGGPCEGEFEKHSLR